MQVIFPCVHWYFNRVDLSYYGSTVESLLYCPYVVSTHINVYSAFKKLK